MSTSLRFRAIARVAIAASAVCAPVPALADSFTLGPEVELAPAPSDGGAPAAQGSVSAWASRRGYLASWSEGGVYRAVRFHADGTAIDAAPIPLQGPIYGATDTGYLQSVTGVGLVFLPDGLGGPGDAGTVSTTQATRPPLACVPGECVQVSDNYFFGGIGDPLLFNATFFPLDGGAATTVQIESVPDVNTINVPFAFASDGVGFLFVRSGVVDVGTGTYASNAVLIGADGGLGDGGSLGTYTTAYSLVWGSHDYLLISADTSSALRPYETYRLDSRGAYVSGPESLPLVPVPNTYSVPAAAWDGRGFLLVGQGASGLLGVEVAEDVVDGGAAPAGLPIFPAAGNPSVASVPSFGALVVADQPRGASATPRAIARWVTLTVGGTGDDGGPGDSGATDGGEDAGAPLDGSAPDATVDTGDAGTGEDAGLVADATTGADATTSADASPGVVPEAGVSGAAGGSSGCGCVVAGGVKGDGGWLALAGSLGFVVAGRRRRSRAAA